MKAALVTNINGFNDVLVKMKAIRFGGSRGEGQGGKTLSELRGSLIFVWIAR